MGREIQSKLNGFLNSFENEMNEFQKLVIIYNYIDYLLTNPDTKEILKNIINRCDKNIDKLKNKVFSKFNLQELGFSDGELKLEDMLWLPFGSFYIVYGELKAYKKASQKKQKEIEGRLQKEFAVGQYGEFVKTFFVMINQYILTHLNKKLFINGEAEKDEAGKTKVYISSKNGIYLNKEKGEPIYSIQKRSKRYKILSALKNNQLSGEQLLKLTGHNNIQLLSQAINSINDLFKEKLNMSNALIIRLDTGGYEFNNEIYNVIFLDENST